MEHQFTEATLPSAVRWLFETNGYSVVGPVHVNGAEIDLVAKQLAGLTTQTVYIEVTVQYVDTAKYGKDLTKLQMFSHDQDTQCLIVSSKGFTNEVRERASQARILTVTYDELLKRFEKTAPYIDHILGESQFAKSLAELDAIYEEPHFQDRHGGEVSTEYLGSWLREQDPKARWLVVVGEYGTGKTALTRVLQRRWTSLYRSSQSDRIPFRIELRDFSKQFDARGLLHHFLDQNELAHMPVSFVESMIAAGRVVLLLDGYDEMAQYLNIRERRACLEALADLASAGARGILTSRPNYFTEAEELRVFEVLYQRLSSKPKIENVDRSVLELERNVDRLLEGFVVERVERQLRDLSPEQTLKLVQRRLGGDSQGTAVVTGILNRVFRLEHGRDVLLSGKPVIISYLLDVVEELKEDQQPQPGAQLTEWQIYSLIVDKLMQRDWARTPDLMPTERRAFLERLALFLSARQAKFLREPEFMELITSFYSTRISRGQAEGRTDIVDSLFKDLRSSATLTRSEEPGEFGWQFSHNSLREYLLVSHLLRAHLEGIAESSTFPVTDSMLSFGRSLPNEIYEPAAEKLSALWPIRRSMDNLDRILLLLWGRISATVGPGQSLRDGLARVVGHGLDLSDCKLYRLEVSTIDNPSDLTSVNFTSAELVEVDFQGCLLREASFSGASLDGCSFNSADCSQADFSDTLLMDCDLTRLNCSGANFRGLYLDSTALVKEKSGSVSVLTGEALLAYLRLQGAETDDFPVYFLYASHPDFQICEKICRVFAEGGSHQRLGVEQRGASERNTRLAKKFVKHLVSAGYVKPNKAYGDLLDVTQDGIVSFGRFTGGQVIDDRLNEFFVENFNYAKK